MKRTSGFRISGSNLWLIFIAALVVRLVYIGFLREGFYFSDFRAYDEAAVSLVEGRGFAVDYSRPPLYPLFLAFNYLLFGIHLFPVRIVQAVLGAYSSVLIFLITRRIFDQKSARMAAWISVFYPYYIFISGLLYSTMITAFFLICTIYFLVLATEKHSLSYIFVASVTLGIASLAVPVCLAFAPFLVLWFFLFSEFAQPKKILFSAVHVIVVALCLVPWTYYSYQRTGRLVLVDARMQEHVPYFTDAQSSELEKREASHRRLGTILSNPGAFLGRMGSEFLHFWSFVPDRVVTKDVDYRRKIHQKDSRMIVEHPLTSPILDWVSILTYGPVFLLAIMGVAFSAGYWRLSGLPVLLLLSHALGYSLFFTQVRYRLPVEFCLMILAGWGAVLLMLKFGLMKRQSVET